MQGEFIFIASEISSILHHLCDSPPVAARWQTFVGKIKHGDDVTMISVDELKAFKKAVTDCLEVNWVGALSSVEQLQTISWFSNSALFSVRR